MIKKVKKHIGYYISLIAILAVGFLLAFLSSPNRDLQLMIVVLTTLFYIFWGIIHHLINHDLYVKIVVEYILIGVLGLTIVLFIL
jgi:hypothetical protein